MLQTANCNWRCAAAIVWGMLASLPVAMVASEPASISVSPATVVLRGQRARQQLVVTGQVAGRSVDVTRLATVVPFAVGFVDVDNRLGVSAISDGQTALRVSVGTISIDVPVQIIDAATPHPISFENDVGPILTRFGCNAGACHGKARGQNGFQLSLLGFYPDFDYAALTQEGRGRRVFPAVPDQSLLLKKGSALTPHGGGKRIEPYGPHYEVLRSWIAQGMPRRLPVEVRVERLEVYPPERIMTYHEEQQLLVTAHSATLPRWRPFNRTSPRWPRSIRRAWSKPDPCRARQPSWPGSWARLSSATC